MNQVDRSKEDPTRDSTPAPDMIGAGDCRYVDLPAGEQGMQPKWLSILAGGAMLFTATGSAFAQGESGGAATSGGPHRWLRLPLKRLHRRKRQWRRGRLPDQSQLQACPTRL